MCRKDRWLMGAGVAMTGAGCLQSPDVVTRDEFDETVKTLEEALTNLESRVAQIEAGDEQFTDLETRVADLEDNVVLLLTGDTTITVGSSAEANFTDLPTALASLDRYRLASDATVTLRLDPGTYSISGPVTIGHPDGARINIVGDTSDPGATVLQFADSDGIVVGPNQALGMLDGVTLMYVGTTNDEAGLRVGANGYLELGSGTAVHTVVEGWAIGISVEGGTLYAEGAVSEGLEITSCTTGVHVEMGGSLHAAFLSVDGSTVAADAVFDSVMNIEDATLSASSEAIKAGYASYVDAYEVTLAEGNLWAFSNSTIQAYSCQMLGGSTLTAELDSQVSVPGCSGYDASRVSTSTDGAIYY